MDSGIQSVIGTVLSGRYRLQSKLGSGGMSTVYLASDETLDRPVAIKLLHAEISDQPDQLERFRREARAAARLSHPNLVAVIDAGEEGGRPYIVFEYIEGETLKRRIQEHGGLAVDEAVAYAIEIGRGLSAAHGRMLVHRDVKPQNVLIDPDGRAKVTDFGIALSLEAQGLTATGRVLGTTDYVSPEQAMGEEVDERSDVYALGVVLYEMLTGDVPYHAETQVGVAMKHVNEPMPDVFERRPEISAAVAAVVDRATAKYPEDRYDSVAEMVRDLEATLEVEAARGGGTTGEATTVLESVPRSQRRLGSAGISRAGVAMGVIGIGLIGAAVLLGSGELDRLRGGGGGDEVKLVDVTDFDPSSTGGDEDEHPEEVGRTIDGNPTVAWSSETYNLEDFGNKPGVGVVVEAVDSVEASAVELRAEPGGDVEIYAAPDAGEPPEDLDGWTLVGQKSNVAQREKIDLQVPGPSSLYLVWFTRLPPADDGDGFRAEIGEITVLA